MFKVLWHKVLITWLPGKQIIYYQFWFSDFFILIVVFKIMYFYDFFLTIELINSFSLNAQAPCSSFINLSLGNIDAVHVNKKTGAYLLPLCIFISVWYKIIPLTSMW